MAKLRPAARKSAVFILIWIAATWGLVFAPVKLALGSMPGAAPVAGFLLLRFLYALCFLIPLLCWQARPASSPV